MPNFGFAFIIPEISQDAGKGNLSPEGEEKNSLARPSPSGSPRSHTALPSTPQPPPPFRKFSAPANHAPLRHQCARTLDKSEAAPRVLC